MACFIMIDQLTVTIIDIMTIKLTYEWKKHGLYYPSTCSNFIPYKFCSVPIHGIY